MPTSIATSTFAEAKTPGKTYCFYRVCHRVMTLEETRRMIGKRMVLATSHYDDPSKDRFNPTNLTSSGEWFRANVPDNAASPKLPNGTVVLAWNPATRQSAVLRINNAGPYWGSRTLDVSRAAAERLGFARQGVATLHVQILRAATREDVTYKKGRRYAAVPGHIGTHASFELALVDASRRIGSQPAPFVPAAAIAALPPVAQPPATVAPPAAALASLADATEAAPAPAIPSSENPATSAAVAIAQPPAEAPTPETAVGLAPPQAIAAQPLPVVTASIAPTAPASPRMAAVTSRQKTSAPKRGPAIVAEKAAKPLKQVAQVRGTAQLRSLTVVAATPASASPRRQRTVVATTGATRITPAPRPLRLSQAPSPLPAPRNQVVGYIEEDEDTPRQQSNARSTSPPVVAQRRLQPRPGTSREIYEPAACRGASVSCELMDLADPPSRSIRSTSASSVASSKRP